MLVFTDELSNELNYSALSSCLALNIDSFGNLERVSSLADFNFAT